MKERVLPDHPLLEIKEIAEYFRVSIKTAYGWKDTGLISHVKYGGRVFIPREAAIEFERQGSDDYIPVKTF